MSGNDEEFPGRGDLIGTARYLGILKGDEPKPVFDDFKRFKWSDLAGKKLEIMVDKSEDESFSSFLVMGRDEIGTLYVLHSERLSKNKEEADKQIEEIDHKVIGSKTK